MSELTIILNLVAAAILFLVLLNFPKVHSNKARFRIDEVEFHDRVRVYYPMRRGWFKWKVMELEEGIRGYRDYDEAQAALEDYLCVNLGLEISQTKTMKEYG